MAEGQGVAAACALRTAAEKRAGLFVGFGNRRLSRWRYPVKRLSLPASGEAGR